MHIPTNARWVTIGVACLGLIGAAVVVHEHSRSDLVPTSAAAGSGADSAGRGPLAPTWNLTDQNGVPVSSADLAGKVQVVSFLFPYCTTYCPATARSMAQLEAEVKGTPLEDKVEIVAFNVDPTGAGRATMRDFWRHFGGDPDNPSVEFLTGSASAVRHVVTDGYKVSYQKVSVAEQDAETKAAKKNGTYVEQPVVPNPVASKAAVDYDVVHNDVLEIVGPDGHIDRVFDQASDVPAPTLLQAVKTAASGA